MSSLIRLSINHLTAVLAVMLMIFLFGLSALQQVPIQLTPDIDRPVLQVRVSWPGASPADVDREIINRLERELGALSGIEKIVSRSYSGQARVTITYSVNQDMDKALTLLLAELSGITGLPDEAKSPIVRTSNSDDSPIARLALTALSNDIDTLEAADLDGLGRFLTTNIMDPLARVEGVSDVFKYGGNELEMRVIIDPEKLAAYRLDITTVISALRSATTQVSVGNIEAGKRDYIVRVTSPSFTLEDAGYIVVRADQTENGNIVPIRLSDIARFEIKPERASSFRRLNGENAIIINLTREQGTNVVETMERLKQKIDDLNANTLKQMGLKLRIIYDETVYISSAISLVQQNIYIGGILAIGILLLFMRSLLPTLIVFCAIPISVVGTFVAISALGLSINVISLAGLAFAVGMVVDASIVSLENIFRLRQSGQNADLASYDGARQVWAPILGSAVTTVVVFLPIIILQLPVGQLFRDIGVAISVAVMISVLVSVTIIPALSSVMLKRKSYKPETLIAIPVIDTIGRGFKAVVLRHANMMIKAPRRGVILIGVVFMIIIGGIMLMMPKLDYLPDGNANFVFGRISVPPGYSVDETLTIASAMEKGARPLWEADPKETDKPAIERFFFVAYGGGAFAGGSTVDSTRVNELRPILMQPILDIPGASVFVSQSSLFGRSVGGSRSIEINVLGNSLSDIEPLIIELNRRLLDAFPRQQGNQVRVVPSLNNNAAQITITPDVLALSRLGISIRDFASYVDVFNDGYVVTQIPYAGDLLDLHIIGEQAGELTIDQLQAMPIVTKDGSIVQLSQLAKVAFTTAPEEIQRLGGRLVMSIIIRPTETLSLEDSIQIIEADIIPALQPLQNDNTNINISGAASELAQTWQAMQANVVLAIFMIYLVMAILLRSFVMPMIILMVVPVSAIGGLIGLAILNVFISQPLDMLTMLGFIILTGIVVNNAILMVEQTSLHYHEDKMPIEEAILEATQNRIRPIFMSTMTSLFGLLPLVIFPGAGSELYRGIGVVVFSGLSLSTITTLFYVPILLSVFRRFIENNKRSAST
ncbi:MAG: efflux RND transporter permease subunit [Candidatus Puniceispirillales bacterium]